MHGAHVQRAGGKTKSTWPPLIYCLTSPPQAGRAGRGRQTWGAWTPMTPRQRGRSRAGGSCSRPVFRVACFACLPPCFVSRVSCLVSRVSRRLASRVSCVFPLLRVLCLVSRVSCFVLRVSCFVLRVACVVFLGHPSCRCPAHMHAGCDATRACTACGDAPRAAGGPRQADHGRHGVPRHHRHPPRLRGQRPGTSNKKKCGKPQTGWGRVS